MLNMHTLHLQNCELKSKILFACTYKLQDVPKIHFCNLTSQLQFTVLTWYPIMHHDFKKILSYIYHVHTYITVHTDVENIQGTVRTDM